MQTCRECGCTDAHACLDDELGACWWVEVDLCSHCAMGLECDHAGALEQRLLAEMSDVGHCGTSPPGPPRPQREGALMTTMARPQITPHELALQLTAVDPITVRLSPFRWFLIIAGLQLALRHPGFPSTCRVVATDWINEMAASFPPDVQELIAQGFNPSFDHPVL